MHRILPYRTCWSGPRRTARAASLRTSQTYNSSPSSQSPSRTYGSSPSSQSPARTYDSSPSSRAPPGPTTPPPVLRAPPLPRRSCSVLQNPASVVVFVTQSPDTTGPNSCHSNFLHVVAKSRHRTRIIVSAPLPLSLHQNNLLILTSGILEILRHSSPAPQSEDQTTLTVVTSDPDAASGYSRCFNILYKLVCPSISFILACLLAISTIQTLSVRSSPESLKSYSFCNADLQVIKTNFHSPRVIIFLTFITGIIFRNQLVENLYRKGFIKNRNCAEQLLR